MIDFPASPTDGQIFSAPNGVVYKWSATYSSWLAQNAIATPVTQSLLLYWSVASGGISGTPSTFGWDVVGENTTGGSYTSGSGLFTIPSAMAGLWDVSFCMQLAVATTATTGLISLHVNSADVANTACYVPNANGVSMVLNGRFRFAVGDVVSTRVSCTGTTTAYGTSSGNRASWLHLTRVAA